MNKGNLIHSRTQIYSKTLKTYLYYIYKFKCKTKPWQFIKKKPFKMPISDHIHFAISKSKAPITLIVKFLRNFWHRFTGKLIHRKIMSTYSFFLNRVVSLTVLLENSPRRNVTYHIWFQLKKRMDEFSSKAACVTTRQMEIPENFLIEFSMICQ